MGAGHRRQKRKEMVNLAFVESDGMRHYLGDSGSAQSKQAYDRLVAEWKANAELMPTQYLAHNGTQLLVQFQSKWPVDTGETLKRCRHAQQETVRIRD